MAPPVLSNPFVGLRTFGSEEDYLFFGRDEQVTELLGRLRDHRFVAVVGTSGSGKSSLVRCGLLSALQRGGLVTAGSHWEVALMQPGGEPLTRLAQALIDAELYDEAEDEEQIPRILATLNRSRRGLAEAVKQSDIEEGGNLLLVVDQFEEIFRFHRTGATGREEAPDFVRLLLEATRATEVSVYVVITMRSDFLGDCSQFRGLAQAVNNGEYLIPKLTRDQTQEAIGGPARVGGGEISWRLSQQLLNDLEDQEDRLPVLQHCLMRLWDHWAATAEEGQPLDIDHYEAIGGMGEALSLHADEVFDALPSDSHRAAARHVFKALTEKGSDGRGVRRPATLAQLAEISSEEGAILEEVIEAYRRPGVTFLMPSVDTDLQRETVIDISHESLMRVWKRLQRWVDDESQSSRIYQRLRDTAELHAQGQAGLYHDPDLQISQAWRREQAPTAAWAERYGGQFAQSMAFLEKSEDEARRAESAAETARQRELEQAQALAKSRARTATLLKGFAMVIGAACLLAVALALWAMKQTQVAEKQTEIAHKAVREAQHAQGRTWLAEADRLSQDGEHFLASLKAARAIGYEGLGREGMAPEAQERFPILLNPDSPDSAQAHALAQASETPTLLWMNGGLRHHPSNINQVTASPDGRVFASISEGEERVRLWNAETGALEALLDAVTGNPEVIAFSPDGRYIAYGNGGELAFYEHRDEGWHALPKRFSILGADIRSLAISPDEHGMLAFGTGSGEIYLWPQWRRFDEAAFPQAPAMPALRQGSRLEELTFSQAAPHLLAAVSREGAGCWLIDTAKAEILRELSFPERHSSPIGGTDPPAAWSVTFTPDGNHLLAAGTRVPVTQWDIASGNVVSVLLQEEWDRIAKRPNGTFRSGNYPCFLGEAVTLSKDGQRLAVVWNQIGYTQEAGLPGLHVSLFEKEATPGSDWTKVKDLSLSTRDEIHHAALSPDGTKLLLGTSGAYLQWWDVEAGHLLGEENVGHHGRGTCLAFSRDGWTFASADARGMICLWDALSGERLHRWRAHGDNIEGLCFNREGTLLFSVGERDTDLNVWDTQTGELQRSYPLPFRVKSLDITPNGEQLIVGGWSNQYFALDPVSLETLGTLQGPHGTNQIRFLPDGETLASLSWDNDISQLRFEVWRHTPHDPSSTLSLSHALPPGAHRQPTEALAIHPAGQRMATARQSIKLWERNAEGVWGRAAEPTFPPLTSHARDMAFNPSGTRLAIAAGNEVSLWDANTGERTNALPNRHAVEALAYRPDGQMLVTLNSYGWIQAWHLPHSPVIAATEALGTSDAPFIFQGAQSVEVAHQTGRIFTQGPETDPTKVVAWRSGINGLTPLFELDLGNDVAGALALSPDEKRLAVASANAESSHLQIWDLEPRRLLHRIPIESPIRRLTFSPDGTLLAGGAEKLFLWDSHSGERLSQSPETLGEILGVDFDPTSRQVFVGARNAGRPLGWEIDPETGQLEPMTPFNDLPFPNDDARALAVSPNGKFLHVVGGNRHAHLIDLDTLEIVSPPLTLPHFGLSTAFSPDGTLVATGCGNNEVVISRADPSQEILQTLHLDRQNSVFTAVTDLAFSASNHQLFTATRADGVRVVSLETSRPTMDLWPYCQVIEFDDATSSASWFNPEPSLNGTPPRRLYPPEAFLPASLQASVFPEAAAAWFRFYFDRQHFRAAHAVWLGLDPSTAELDWPQISRQLVTHIEEVAASSQPSSTLLPAIDLAEALFAHHPPGPTQRLRFWLAGQRWDEVEAFLENELPRLPVEDREAVASTILKTLAPLAEKLLHSLDQASIDPKNLPPLKWMLAHVLAESHEAFGRSFAAGGPAPDLMNLPISRLLEPYERLSPALVRFGEEWEYYTKLGPAPEDWNTSLGIDEDWQRGAAPLGFGSISGGDLSLATRLEGMETRATGQLTYFFRRAFANPEEASRLGLSILRDDGVVVYLDGEEIFRNNLPGGRLGPDTTANTAIDGAAESQRIEAVVEDASLNAGNHVLAVEVHQANSTSSDISLDLSLHALRAAVRTPEALSDTIAWLERLDPEARHLPWLAHFTEREPPAQSPAEPRRDVEWGVDVYLLFHHDPTERLSLINARLESLENETSVHAISERIRRLYQKLALLSLLNRPEEEIAAVRRALSTFPSRDPSFGARHLDLSAHYNANIFFPQGEPGWIGGRASNLAHLPATLTPRHGVAFDVRGAVNLNSGPLPVQNPDNPTFNELNGKDYPDRLDGIEVEQSASRIHFLMSCHWGREEPGVPVARFEIHYADGTSDTLPVVYGTDVSDWYVASDQDTRPLEEKIGFRGRNGTDRADIELSELIWQNPHPEMRIRHIDYISELKAAAPFLLGITLE